MKICLCLCLWYLVSFIAMVLFPTLNSGVFAHLTMQILDWVCICRCLSPFLWAVAGIRNYFSFKTHKTFSAMASSHTYTRAHKHTHKHSLVLFAIINPFGDLRILPVKVKGLFFCWTKPHQKTSTYTHTRRYTHDDTHIENYFVVWHGNYTHKLTHLHTHTCTGTTRISKEWKPQCLKIRIFPLFFLLYVFVCAWGSWASYER